MLPYASCNHLSGELSHNVTLLTLWDEHTLLCCSRWQGLLLLDLKTGKYNPPPFDCGKEIMNIFIDSQKRIWVAPYNGGLNCLTRDGKLLATYTTRNSSLSNNVVLSLAEREGQIWIGTDGGGINILDPETGQFSYWNTSPEEITIHFLPIRSYVFITIGIIICGQAASETD